MPIISGPISRDGAIIAVVVGVSPAREQRLRGLQMAVPQPVPVRAQIDPGSEVTGLMCEVFADLQIQPFGRTRLRTPSTRPDEPFFADEYEVSLSFVSGMIQHPFGLIRAIACADFRRGEEVEAILGRDVLARCVFQYYGPQRHFEIFF